MLKMYKILVSVVCFVLFLSVVISSGKAAASNNTGRNGENGQDGVISCTVLETMNAAGYTYFKADMGEDRGWVAIPMAVLKEGDRVSFYQGMKMVNFFSRTLSRTFGEIIFSPGLVGQVPKEVVDTVNSSREPEQKSRKAVVGEPNGLENRISDTRHMPRQIDPQKESGGSVAAIAMQEEIALPRAEGEHAFTVGELYAKRKALSGKTVRVRGKVVKYSPNIMGRNWLHIQDGSGNALENSHDLVVTTTEIPENMNDITIEGIVATDRDFGAGYRYSVIIEKAVIKK